MKEFFNIDQRLIDLDTKALEKCEPVFKEIDKITKHNQHKVLSAFIKNGVSEAGRTLLKFTITKKRHEQLLVP